MARNLFTQDELVLCTYAALFDVDDIGGCDAISELTGRPTSSISLKIRNIAATLDSKGYARQSTVQGLSGRITGESARDTNWEYVQPLALLSQESLLEKCRRILEVHGIADLKVKSADQLASEYKAALARMDALQRQMESMRLK